MRIGEQLRIFDRHTGRFELCELTRMETADNEYYAIFRKVGTQEQLATFLTIGNEVILTASRPDSINKAHVYLMINPALRRHIFTVLPNGEADAYYFSSAEWSLLNHASNKQNNINPNVVKPVKIKRGFVKGTIPQ